MMIKNKLPKKFVEQFPKATKVAARNDADITCRQKSFWLDKTVQLTGFKINSDKKSMTQADNDDVAEKRLLQWEQGLAELKAESLRTRFERCVSEAVKLPLQWKCFSVFRHPGGDQASVFSDGTQIGVSLVGVEKTFYGKGKNVEECAVSCRENFQEFLG